MKKDNFKKLITESQEQCACLDFLKRVGFVVNRMNTGAMKVNNPNGKDRFIRFNEAGYPDILNQEIKVHFFHIDNSKK